MLFGTSSSAASPTRVEMRVSRKEVTYLMGSWEEMELATPALQRANSFQLNSNSLLLKKTMTGGVLEFSLKL